MRISSGSLALSSALLLIPAGAMADHRLPDERPATSFEDFRERLHGHVGPWIDDPMLELRQPHGGFLAIGLADELGYVVPRSCYVASYGAYWGLVPTLISIGRAADRATLDVERGQFRKELARAVLLTEADADRCASRSDAAAEVVDEATPAASTTAEPDAIVELEATPALRFEGEGGELVSTIAVVPGGTVTIRVDNTAGFDHSFWIGSKDELEEPASTTDAGIPTWTEGTREFVWNVPEDVSGLMFGCTVPGHFASMHGIIVAAAAD